MEGEAKFESVDGKEQRQGRKEKGEVMLGKDFSVSLNFGADVTQTLGVDGFWCPAVNAVGQAIELRVPTLVQAMSDGYSQMVVYIRYSVMPIRQMDANDIYRAYSSNCSPIP